MLKIDLHTHSIASGHAFNTIYELAQAASQKGVELIGITDHGPSMKGAAHLEYFSMARRIPKELFGVKILFGCEANIIDFDGTIDVPTEYLRFLDLVLVGFHKLTAYPENSTKEQNTIALIKAIERYPVNIIAHPYRIDFPIIVEEVLKAGSAHDTLLEINNSVFQIIKSPRDDKLITETAKIIDFYKRNKGKTVITSDAHIASEIANDSNILQHLEILGLDQTLIINSIQELCEFSKLNIER